MCLEAWSSPCRGRGSTDQGGQECREQVQGACSNEKRRGLGRGKEKQSQCSLEQADGGKRPQTWRHDRSGETR